MLAQQQHECVWIEKDVVPNAARNGNVPMLAWLQQRTKPWDHDAMNSMLFDAGCVDKLDAVSWFIQQVPTIIYYPLLLISVFSCLSSRGGCVFVASSTVTTTAAD
jgi:hypothetical protein